MYGGKPKSGDNRKSGKMYQFLKDGGPENGITFGVLGRINPKFDPTKAKFRNSFEAWYELVPPV